MNDLLVLLLLFVVLAATAEYMERKRAKREEMFKRYREHVQAKMIRKRGRS